ncbi:MAG: hypothetical protein ACR2F6_17620 [Mycobacteriales bacterium]
MTVVQEPAEDLRKLELERLDRMYQAALKVLKTEHVMVQHGKIVCDEDGIPVPDDAPVLAAIDRLLSVQTQLITYGTAPDTVDRIVVAVDPAVTSGVDSDETGIVVAGVAAGRFWILDDLSGRYSPDGWAGKAVAAFDDYHADRIIAEVNNGGDMVERIIRSHRPGIPYTSVRASRGKAVRAEPVAALYEQGKVTHVRPFVELEDQLCNFTPDERAGHDDRLDALVWACTALDIRRAVITSSSNGQPALPKLPAGKVIDKATLWPDVQGWEVPQWM